MIVFLFWNSFWEWAGIGQLLFPSPPHSGTRTNVSWSLTNGSPGDWSVQWSVVRRGCDWLTGLVSSTRCTNWTLRWTGQSVLILSETWRGRPVTLLLVSQSREVSSSLPLMRPARPSHWGQTCRKNVSEIFTRWWNIPMKVLIRHTSVPLYNRKWSWPWDSI